jgi:predicted nuclease of predicted toxin-antitoxin system
LKILVDVNLAPAWIGFLTDRGIEARHWSDVGDLRAPDAEIMQWAHQHGVVFTHDLDYSALLAATQARGPSVLQVRTQDVLPAAIGELVIRVLDEQRECTRERGDPHRRPVRRTCEVLAHRARQVIRELLIGLDRYRLRCQRVRSTEPAGGFHGSRARSRRR